ncbi:MAG: ABC transporter ATP-binding protein [Gammaproteobacteria bacterium]|jgi:ABC-2 type transport system ATP-binding protein
MTDPILEARNLEKRYPGVTAVDGVSISVPTGRCFGLLGPNGAGKTTTLEMLEGITEPSSGEILFRGAARGRGFREVIGIQFQSTSLQDFLTVREVMRFFAALYPRHAGIDDLVQRCELADFLDRDTRKLSGGQRQRLLLALALINEPDLVFLDEPTTGLDPQSRRNFWRLIESIRAEGKTILLTTHYMEEAERLCDEVAIMDRGRVVARGTPRALLLEHFPPSVIRLPASALPGRVRIPGVREAGSGQVEIFTDDVPHTLAELEVAGVALESLRVGSPTLEDLFIQLTGHQLRA